MAKQNADFSKNPLKGGLIALMLGSAVMIFGCSGVMDKIKGAEQGGEDEGTEKVEVTTTTGTENTTASTASGTMTTTVATDGTNAAVNAGGTTVTTDGANTAVTAGGTTVTTDGTTASVTVGGKTITATTGEGSNDEDDNEDEDEAKDDATVATVKTTFSLRGGGGKVAVRGDVPKDASWTGMLKPGKHFFNVRPDNGAQKSLGVEVEAGRVNTFCYDVKKDAWCSKH